MQVSNPCLSCFGQRLRRSLSAWSGGFIAAGLIFGVQISWQQSSLQLKSSAAQAQTRSATISAEEVAGYARAVLQMDRPRTEAYTQIKNILMAENLNASEFNISCTNANNLSNLPRRTRRQIQEIVVRYCTQAAEVVASSGLSVNRFNEITAAHQQEPALQAQIRQAMIDLQQ
ncbi:MAG: DUF4168 domain-containing protein [Leptolyngbyaceae cyanobacterium SM1_1_3]|nr:DUF4168 domain-containing protein [Leptolyngbyaceae cyanobacterium SM1_1_3]NJN01620.1 DUF4168 domain-containing protein [Leptolyngbyaceae cyanobacterium RM1_1_2]NJO09865.1 DUF4168 domain-containing protein [Leptolyngbyaceae cyanobacterium SL_1_1]